MRYQNALAAGLCLLALANVTSSNAQSTWGGTVSALWSVPGNWVGGVGPNLGGPTTTIMFPASPNQAVDLDMGPVTLNSLTTSAAYTFSGAPFEFGANAGGATLTSGGGPLTFTNDVFYDVPLTVLANTDIAFGNLGGSVGFVKQGPGIMSVTTMLGPIGPVAVQAGTLTASQIGSATARPLAISAGANVNTGPASWGALSGAGNVALGGTTTFDQGATNTTFTGNIIGASDFRKSGTGTLTLLGSNTYTGTTFVSAGRLEVGNGAAGTFANGPVSVSNTATLALNPTNAAIITTMSVGTTGTVEVNGGTLTDSGAGWGFPGNFTVNGGAVTTTFIGTGGTLTVNAPGSFTMNNGGGVGGLTGNGSVVSNGGIFLVGNAANFTFDGVISGTVTVIKDQPGTLTITAAQAYFGDTSVVGGTLLMNGSVGSTSVDVAGTLGGTGSVGTLLVQPPGILAPGVTTGTLSTGNIRIDGTLAAQVEGPAAGQHDRVAVTGTVLLNGATLALSGSYGPNAGDVITLIGNDGVDAVTGTFTGLAEGATIAFNGRTLRISYAGGDGNDVTLTPQTIAITATAGPNGTITPLGSVPVAIGGTATFTITPSLGYGATVGGTCPLGTLLGNMYTTGTITTACTVTVGFTLLAITSFTGPTTTGTGNATASFTGGGPTCTYATAQFIPLTGHAASPPAGSAPDALAFPHGLFDFRLTGCNQGTVITMTIAYPTPLPAGTQYWKYGPTPGDVTPHWYVLPATITGNTVVFTITDGSTGDDDLAINGIIVDQGGPGTGIPGPIATPTMSEWMLMLLASLMLAMGMWSRAERLRRPRHLTG